MNNNETVDELKKLLRDIKDKPGLYLGKKSIIRLKAFIDGFLYAHYLINQKKEYIEFYPGFNQWIAKKYDIHSSHNWSSIIMFYEEDEANAFDRFYELLDEYVDELGK